jgi:superfamily II DNA or RNA helicase
VLDACKKKRLAYELIDARDPMPAPQVKNMKGFRNGQFTAVINFLSPNRSGILKCPTRWGKTVALVNVIRAYPNTPTILAAPGVDLMRQLVDELKAALPGRTITGLFTGSKDKNQSQDITVCSLDSLEKINPDHVRLLLIDEPHAIATPSRMLNVAKFKHARIYGFGATVEGRFDGADIITEGLVGPVLYERTFQQAVADGAICPLVVYMLKLEFPTFECQSRDHAYRYLVYKNKDLCAIVQEIVASKIPEDWQTLIFADQQKQVDLINQFVESGVGAVASRMNTKERREMFAAMKAGTIKRCVSTSIYAQGVTFPDLRVIINTSGGGGSITGTQKPGRLAQIRPGKKAGYLVDFLLEPKDWHLRENQNYGPLDKWSSVVFDCRNRMKVYQENGYDVRIVRSVDEINFE